MSRAEVQTCQLIWFPSWILEVFFPCYCFECLILTHFSVSVKHVGLSCVRMVFCRLTFLVLPDLTMSSCLPPGQIEVIDVSWSLNVSIVCLSSHCHVRLYFLVFGFMKLSNVSVFKGSVTEDGRVVIPCANQRRDKTKNVPFSWIISPVLLIFKVFWIFIFFSSLKSNLGSVSEWRAS